MKRRVSAGAELAIDRRDHDVHVGDAAVGGPCLLAVENPLAGRLVELRRGAQRRDVRAGVGLGGAERRHLDVIRRAEAARDPLTDLLAGALTEDRRHREGGPHDRHADPGIAPEQLLVDERERQAGGIGEELREPFEAVEPDLGCLFDDRPGGLLLLVPLVRGRPYDISRETVDPVANVLLILGQLERKGDVLAGSAGNCLDGGLSGCGRRGIRGRRDGCGGS